MKSKLSLFAILLTVVTITLCSIAIKSYNNRREKKEVEQIKTQVYESLKVPYAKSDSAVSAISKDSISAKHSDVEDRRFR